MARLKSCPSRLYLGAKARRHPESFNTHANLAKAARLRMGPSLNCRFLVASLLGMTSGRQQISSPRAEFFVQKDELSTCCRSAGGSPARPEPRNGHREGSYQRSAFSCPSNHSSDRGSTSTSANARLPAVKSSCFEDVFTALWDGNSTPAGCGCQ